MTNSYAESLLRNDSVHIRGQRGSYRGQAAAAVFATGAFPNVAAHVHGQPGAEAAVLPAVTRMSKEAAEAQRSALHSGTATATAAGPAKQPGPCQGAHAFNTIASRVEFFDSVGAAFATDYDEPFQDAARVDTVPTGGPDFPTLDLVRVAPSLST
jgi:hypothetical protein